MRAAPVTAAALLCALALAAPAQGAKSLVIRGAGYGHGVGLSQYGTLGFARHGWTHDRILAHYYSGTKLGRLTSSPTVRVLLRSRSPRYAVTGAADANGMKLDPAKRYVVTGGGRGAVLRDAKGKSLATAAPPLRLSAARGSTILLEGPAENGLRDGVYRGAMEFRPGVGGLLAVNAISLEEYVAGVISAEVPGGMAGRGAARAGDRRAHLRDHRERRRRRGLHPVRRHALADVPRRRRRDAGDDGGRARDRLARRDLRRQARDDVLLLDLRRAHRERRELVRRRRSRSPGSRASRTPTTTSRRATAGARSSSRSPARRRSCAASSAAGCAGSACCAAASRRASSRPSSSARRARRP